MNFHKYSLISIEFPLNSLIKYHKKPINEAQDIGFYIEKLKSFVNSEKKLRQNEENTKKKALNEISLENQSRYFGYTGNQFFSVNDEFSGGNVANQWDYNYNRPQSRVQDPATQRKLEMDRM